MKKYIYLLVLLMSDCTASEQLQKQNQQFTADVEAIGPEAQIAYYACGYEEHLWECRQKIWDSHPKPHMPGHESRDFILHYLDAVERKGAENVLQAEHKPCGRIEALDYAIWHEGRYAECSNGQEYQILKDDKHWQVTQTKGGAR